MYYRKDIVIQNTMGQALAGAQLYVCAQPANITTMPPSPLAMVWSDPEGYYPQDSQPLIADGTGHFSYYAQADFYTEVFFYQGQLFRILPDQMVGPSFGGGGGPVPYTFALFSDNVYGAPDQGMTVMLYTAFTPNVFAPNFGGSYGTVGANPAAYATYTVLVNGAQMGTVQISPSGAFTFLSNGFSMNPGDRLQMLAPVPADSALSDVAISLVGTRLS